MTNETILNVPRELVADLLGNDHDKRIMAERHLLAMLANAPSPANHVEDVRAMVADPSPAGVDGLEVEAYLHTMHMEIGQTRQFCSKWKGDPFGIAGEDYSSAYAVTSDPLCRLSGATAIIDGLRGENEALHAQVKVLRSDANSWQSGYDEGRRMGGKHCALTIDQQSQRIGELEGLLREAMESMWVGERDLALLARLDAALSEIAKCH